MTIETLLTDMIAQLPNLAIAVAVLYWQKQTIDKLLDHQRSLLDKMLEMVKREEERTESIARSYTVIAPKQPHNGGAD